MKTILANCKTVYFPQRTLAYLFHKGPYMGNTTLFEQLFNEVSKWMTRQGLFRSTTEALTIYHDDPERVSPENQRISVGFTVPEGTNGEGNIKTFIIPAGRYAVGSFEIDVDEYGDAWKSLFDYIASEDLHPSSGIMYESYKNDPSQHPQGKHVVDIVVQV